MQARSFKVRWLMHCLLWMVVLPLTAGTPPLRITHLYACGDIFSTQAREFCISIQGTFDTKQSQVWLGEQRLPARLIQQEGTVLKLRLPVAHYQSGPLWLVHQEEKSNPVWLSLAGSYVVAARPEETATNMDGLTTYVDLVSIIIEENFEGLQEARLLAKKYQATVVGAIPPLNTYQLRLPVRNLTERDALVLRLGSETSVDAVIIEDTAPEQQAEAESSATSSMSHPKNPSPQDDWTANRFVDAVDFYRRRVAAKNHPLSTHPIKIGVIERDIDFDSPDFADYLGNCRKNVHRTCVYARDTQDADNHGSTVTGIFAARWNNGGNSGFLRALDEVGPGFDVIVDRNSDAGITANIAASVNLVEDGVRILNWSWGLHRVGAKTVEGDAVDSLVRSGLAMSGYEELLEEFFLWLRAKHPDVMVINSAGNGASFSGQDDYRLPSSFVSEHLLVVGGHERNPDSRVKVTDPDYVIKRASSNADRRVDITAAACVQGSTRELNTKGEKHCGTSYATPLVAAVVAAMWSLNPRLTPDELRILLRRSAMTIGEETDFEPADGDDLTTPILPSERDNRLDHPDIGRSARLDMHKALDLAVQSLQRVR